MTDSDKFSQFRYEESPFFITDINAALIDDAVKRIDKGYPSELITVEVILKTIGEAQLAKFSFTQEIILEEKFGTNSDEIELYFLGLAAPFLLIKAVYYEILLGKDDATKFILSQPEKNEIYTKFHKYLLSSLPFCIEMFKDVKDCRIIMEHTRQLLFNQNLYYQLGIEAAYDALIKCAVEIAAHQYLRDHNIKLEP